MEANARFGDADGHLVEVFCECGWQGCAERVAITRDAYEHVRSDGSTFAMVAGHEVGIVEQIVERGPDYVIARNLGVAEGIARDADPRCGCPNLGPSRGRDARAVTPQEKLDPSPMAYAPAHSRCLRRGADCWTALDLYRAFTALVHGSSYGLSHECGPRTSRRPRRDRLCALPRRSHGLALAPRQGPLTPRRGQRVPSKEKPR